MITVEYISNAMFAAYNEHMMSHAALPRITEVYLGDNEYMALRSSVEFLAASEIRQADVPERFLGFSVYRVNWHRHLRIVIK